jgi:hypothetical protein
MQLGNYGSIESSILEKYRLECHHRWPQANIFQINQSQSSISSPLPPCDSPNNDGGAVSINQN